MFLRFLFTRSEVRGTLILTASVVAARILLFAVRPAAMPDAGDLPRHSAISQAQPKKPVRIEINGADSVKLLEINGIGPVFANRIIRYRKSLGGFRHPGQLLEVYGMDTVRWNSLKDQIRIDTSGIRRMDVNRASFKELLAHPYLEYEQVKALCRFRDRKGRLHSPDELRAAGVLPDTVLDKLLPYLTADGDSVQKVPGRLVN